MESVGGKVSIIGAGSVGATLAFDLALKGSVTEIALIDSNRDKAEAEVLDIKQGASMGRPVKIGAAGYEACRDSEIVVITAGARQHPGESRMDLLARNASIMKGVTRSAMDSGFAGIFLVITNPVDVLTWIVFAESGLPASRVVGSGTTLDSSRLREYVARHCSVNPQNIHGYILGEHGDSSFPAWSMLNIGGMRLEDFCRTCGACEDMEGFKRTAAIEIRQAAYRIIAAKGSTYYAIAQAASAIVESILRDERRILPVSTARKDFRGLARTAFSFPTIVGKGGASPVLDFSLSPEEEECLMASARFIAENIAGAGY